MLQTQTVTAKTLALIKRLMADPQLSEFNLVGGTALALIMGHRESIDIDLFTNKPFDAPETAAILNSAYGAIYTKTGQGSIQCFIDGIKTDMISHRYPVIKPVEAIEGIRMMSLPDIAAMKLHAIVNSGSRIKDFIDVHFMLERLSLSEMYTAYETKYYPNTSRSVASMALRDHTHIDFKVPVKILDGGLDWSKIESRLLRAIERPEMLFPTNRQRPDLKVKVPRQRKRGI